MACRKHQMRTSHDASNVNNFCPNLDNVWFHELNKHGKDINALSDNTRFEIKYSTSNNGRLKWHVEPRYHIHDLHCDEIWPKVMKAVDEKLLDRLGVPLKIEILRFAIPGFAGVANELLCAAEGLRKEFAVHGSFIGEQCAFCVR